MNQHTNLQSFTRERKKEIRTELSPTPSPAHMYVICRGISTYMVMGAIAPVGLGSASKTHMKVPSLPPKPKWKSWVCLQNPIICLGLPHSNENYGSATITHMHCVCMCIYIWMDVCMYLPEMSAQ